MPSWSMSLMIRAVAKHKAISMHSHDFSLISSITVTSYTLALKTFVTSWKNTFHSLDFQDRDTKAPMLKMYNPQYSSMKNMPAISEILSNKIVQS